MLSNKTLWDREQNIYFSKYFSKQSAIQNIATPNFLLIKRNKNIIL
jgi:hypothetical protein